MFPTLLTLWRTLSGKAPQKDRSRRRPAFRLSSCRPRLEALEDRCVPSATLDSTFGTGGIVTTALGYDAENTLGDLLQSNGDIIAYGRTAGINGLCLERYTPSGSLDTTFGSGGIVSNTTMSRVNQAALQADGKIVVVGFSQLVRYNSNGSLDTTFGSEGVVNLPTNFDGWSLLIQPSNGDILVGGGALLRYTPNGTLDSTFGSGGEAPRSYPIQSLALANGDIVAGGIGRLTWYTLSGSLDTTFGSGGIVTTQVGGGAGMGRVSLLVQPNGQIVDVGIEHSGAFVLWALARYNTDGSLDTTFGSGGIVTSNITGSDGAFGSALESNGLIVVVGLSEETYAFELGVYNPNGSPDANFGSGGFVTTSWLSGPPGGYPGAGVVIQPDGKMVVAATNGLDSELARYLPPVAQTGPSFVITGPTTLTAGTAGAFTLTTLNPDGSADSGYSGTVQIISSDPQAVLPGNVAITGGTGTFTVTLKTAGVQSLTATDTVTSGINGSDASIQVNPAAATHFVLNGPSSVRANTAFSLTVTAVDAYGNVAIGYTGTVHFTDSATGATLPANYTFSTSNDGVHTFSGLKLKTKGSQTITVADTVNNLILGTWTIDVT